MKVLPVAKDGYRFIIPLLVLSVIAFGIAHTAQSGWTYTIATLLFLAAAFCIFFFRDFDRATLLNDALIYSPGDGRILEVATLNEGEHKGARIIRIFLSVLNGHVQRAPIKGHIQRIFYKKGVFLDARDPNAHIQNEQNALTIESSKGTLIVTQIAGLIARRIVCWAKEGQSLEQGERFGLIRFGSQVDVVLPISSRVRVQVGDVVVGGLTILAEW